MANDRMYLKSKISGVRICIATSSNDGWSASNKIFSQLDEIFEQYQDEFYDNPHAWYIEFESECDNSECTSKHQESISEEEQKRFSRSMEKCIKEKQANNQTGCFDCPEISYHSVPVPEEKIKIETNDNK